MHEFDLMRFDVEAKISEFECSPFAREMIKPLLCALGLMLLSLPTLASVSIPCQPDPLSGAVAIYFDFTIGGGYRWSEEEDLQLFGGRAEDRQAYEARVTAEVREQLRVAGYGMETNRNSWQTDRATYESTGVPHHTLTVVVSGEGIQHEGCASTLYFFRVTAVLDAQFLTPDFETVETYSREWMSYASEANIETKILEKVSDIVAEIQGGEGFPENFPGSFGRCRARRKETLQFNDGKHSLDLTEAGYDDLLGYLRRETSGEPVTAELFTEPRSRFPKPMATFPLAAVSVPSRMLLSRDAQFLVTIGHWPQNQYGDHWYQEFVTIHRSDGSLVKRLSLTDLLTERDRKNIYFKFRPPANWPQADHFIDQSNRALILELPPCRLFGHLPRGVECHKGSPRIEILLADGRLAQPKQDLLPRLEYRVALAEMERESAGPVAADRRFRCRPGWSAESFQGAPTVDLESRLPAVSMPLPEYSAIAAKVRVTGTAELELLLSASGEVACVAVIKGLSLGLAKGAGETALGWHLQPLEPDAGLSRSRVMFNFHSVVVAPPD